MIDRTTRLRWRRRFRRSKKQVEVIGVQAEDKLEREFFKRLSRLSGVRRFVVSWIMLFTLLIAGLITQTRALGNYHQALKPAPGGIYSEGMVGTFTNANPLYASGGVDSSVSRLLFSSLLKFDQDNQLVGDLAERYTADPKGTQFAVTLRENLKWHDGKPITVNDVIFTYNVIQNPDAKSPLGSSWQGVKVTALDERTVLFTLPNALSAFPYSLTNGIVPRHILEGVPMAQLRSIGFNTVQPVGSGPFKWDAIEVTGSTPATREQSISLVGNDQYHHGATRLNRFIVKTFTDEKRLLQRFEEGQLNAVIGQEIVPDELKKDATVYGHNIPLTGGVFVFFKNSHDILADVKVRQALSYALNSNEIIAGMGYPVRPVRQPFLQGQVGFNKELNGLSQNPDEANKLLDAAGWTMDADGIRKKAGRPLTFRLYALNSSEYTYVTQALQKQWRAVGAQIEVLLQADSDLQTTIAFHNYDALLHGISIGADPDVFAYWHSSQADLRSRTRLNFSEYKSKTADSALEAGRTRSDPQLRAVKYKPFLEAWRTDAPAVALYQPRILYLTKGPVYGFEPTTFNTGTDRFSNVHQWMVRQARASQ